MTIVRWVLYISIGMWLTCVLYSYDSLKEHMVEYVLDTVKEEILIFTAEFNILGFYFFFFERGAGISKFICNIGSILSWIGSGCLLVWGLGVYPIVKAWLCYKIKGIKNQTHGMCTDDFSPIISDPTVRAEFYKKPGFGTEASDGFLWFSSFCLGLGIIMYLVLNRVASKRVKSAVARIKNE